MVALRDVLSAGPPVPNHPDKIGHWRRSLDDETRTAFDKAIGDEGVWPAATLARVLSDGGFKVSDNAIRAYRARLAREGAR